MRNREPCPRGRGTQTQVRAASRRGSPAPVPPGGPAPPPRSAGSQEKGGMGRSGKARILPQAGVHLALVGPDLPVAPVFLVHELVLVVLIHVHLPEPGGRHRVLRHPRSRAAAKASSSCGLYLGEPSRPGTRNLVPSLPSSALGRRRQPRLGRFWACALTTRLPPGVLAQIEPPTPPGSPPGSAREGGSGTQCAGADALQRRGGAERRRRGRRGRGRGRALGGAAARAKRQLGVQPSHVTPRGFHRNASLRSSLGGLRLAAMDTGGGWPCFLLPPPLPPTIFIRVPRQVRLGRTCL